MQDKVVMVTGANAGVGFALCRALAQRGAHVVMACRSADRAASAHAQLLAEVPQAQVTILRLDVSEPASIRAAGDEFAARVGQLDVLVHNAGIFGVPRARNSAGHELHLATNYLGPFALTGTLLPCFRDAPGARIVNVGSLAHRFGRLELGALGDGNGDGEYSPFSAYARSKVALLSYTLELDRRLKRQGSRVIAVGAHPGFAPTDIARGHRVANPKGPIGRWLTARMEGWLQSVEQAAEPILCAACAPDVQGGDYYGPGGWLEISGAPARARVARLARDPRMAQRLWSTSESLTGMRYLSDAGVA